MVGRGLRPRSVVIRACVSTNPLAALDRARERTGTATRPRIGLCSGPKAARGERWVKRVDADADNRWTLRRANQGPRARTTPTHPMNQRIADALVLVFSPGASLRELDRLGILERECALFHRLSPLYA